MRVRVLKTNFITGQKEREETTQNTTVTKSAACASYKSIYVTYITATGVCKTMSDRFKRFVFQRCRLLLVVNVKKSTLSANMRHCTVMKRSLDEQLFCKRQYIHMYLCV